MVRRIISNAVLLVLCLAPLACSHSGVHVFGAKPPIPYRVLGMVNGSGPNEASAMASVVENAQQVGANGVIMTGRKMLGSLVVVNGQAILYSGDLPPEQPAGP